MLEQVSDIWSFYYEFNPIVITTNIGWKQDGKNVMGAGIAQKASKMYPDLPIWYGKRCKKYKDATAACYYEPGRFILYPTKPLNINEPWRSWDQKSSIKLIIRSTVQLAALVDILSQRHQINKVGLPMVGCGCGGLEPTEVKKILHDSLDDRFVLFYKNNNHKNHISKRCQSIQ